MHGAKQQKQPLYYEETLLTRSMSIEVTLVYLDIQKDHEENFEILYLTVLWWQLTRAKSREVSSNCILRWWDSRKSENLHVSHNV